MDNIYHLVGNRIRAARKNCGQTLEELAHGASLTPSFIGQIERGERKMSLDALHRIAAALGLHPVKLLDGSSQSRQTRPAARIAGLVARLSTRHQELAYKLLRVFLRESRKA